MPLQSIIMKAALLPGYAHHDTLGLAARKAGEWLRGFHKVSTDMPCPFEPAGVVGGIGAALRQLPRRGAGKTLRCAPS